MIHGEKQKIYLSSFWESKCLRNELIQLTTSSEIEVIKTDVKKLAIDNIACGYESMA